MYVCIIHNVCKYNSRIKKHHFQPLLDFCPKIKSAPFTNDQETLGHSPETTRQANHHQSATCKQMLYLYNNNIKTSL